MSARSLADCILILHALFVAIVVLSVPLIITGGIRHWAWVRSPWFRFTHLVMIMFVASESLTGITCPLTTLENNLRIGAAQQGYGEDGFIATWLGTLLFYHFPSWVFMTAYVGFAVLVGALFYFVPLKRRPNGSSS